MLQLSKMRIASMFTKDEVKLLNKGLEVLGAQATRARVKEAADAEMVEVIDGRISKINAVIAKLNTKGLFDEPPSKK